METNEHVEITVQQPLRTNRRTAVYALGLGNKGQLGLRRMSQSLVIDPGRISDLDCCRISRVFAGGNSSFAVSDDGLVYSWGDDRQGQIATGRKMLIRTPHPVMKNFKHIAPAKTHAVALNDQGVAYSWGTGAKRKTGHKTQSDLLFPKKVTDIFQTQSGGEAEASTSSIKSVACGESYSVFATENELMISGDWMPNKSGKGRPDKSESEQGQNFLKRIEGAPANIKMVASGSYHILILTESGEIYGFGDNLRGQLGIGKPPAASKEARQQQDPKSPDTDRSYHVKEPKKITSGNNRFISICAGKLHSCGLSDRGCIFVWGCGSQGQLGHGNFKASFEPVQVNVGEEVISIACGDWHTACITKQGSLYVWGAWRQPGYESSIDRATCTPFKITFTSIMRPLIGDAKPIDVACGSKHTLFLLEYEGGLGFGNGFWNPFTPCMQPQPTIDDYEVEEQRDASGETLLKMKRKIDSGLSFGCVRQQERPAQNRLPTYSEPIRRMIMLGKVIVTSTMSNYIRCWSTDVSVLTYATCQHVFENFSGRVSCIAEPQPTSDKSGNEQTLWWGSTCGTISKSLILDSNPERCSVKNSEGVAELSLIYNQYIAARIGENKVVIFSTTNPLEIKASYNSVVKITKMLFYHGFLFVGCLDGSVKYIPMSDFGKETNHTSGSSGDKSFKLLNEKAIQEPAFVSAMHCSENFIYFGTANGQIRYNKLPPHNSAESFRIKPNAEIKSHSRGITFLAERKERFLFSASCDGHVLMWDLANINQDQQSEFIVLRRIGHHYSTIDHSHFSCSGFMFIEANRLFMSGITTSAQHKHSLQKGVGYVAYVFDVEKLINPDEKARTSCTHILKGHRGPLTCGVFDIKQETIYTGSDDGNVRAYKLTKGKYFSQHNKEWKNSALLYGPMEEWIHYHLKPKLFAPLIVLITIVEFLQMVSFSFIMESERSRESVQSGDGQDDYQAGSDFAKYFSDFLDTYKFDMLRIACFLFIPILTVVFLWIPDINYKIFSYNNSSRSSAIWKIAWVLAFVLCFIATNILFIPVSRLLIEVLVCEDDSGALFEECFRGNHLRWTVISGVSLLVFVNICTRLTRLECDIEFIGLPDVVTRSRGSSRKSGFAATVLKRFFSFDSDRRNREFVHYMSKALPHLDIWMVMIKLCMNCLSSATMVNQKYTALAMIGLILTAIAVTLLYCPYHSRKATAFQISLFVGIIWSYVCWYLRLEMKTDLWGSVILLLGGCAVLMPISFIISLKLVRNLSHHHHSQRSPDLHDNPERAKIYQNPAQSYNATSCSLVEGGFCESSKELPHQTGHHRFAQKNGLPFLQVVDERPSKSAKHSPSRQMVPSAITSSPKQAKPFVVDPK